MIDTNYEIGIGYVKSGDYESALMFLNKSLEKGNPKAANCIGILDERNGEYEEAAAMYNIAGCAGVADAIYNYAELLEKGRGVPQNFKLALKYYESAASKGSSAAYAKIALLYNSGFGVKQDHKKAINYLEQGIKLEKKEKWKNANCASMLALFYSLGSGVKKDFKKAAFLWKICAKHGHANAAYNLAICYLNGSGIKKNIDSGIRILIRLACERSYGHAMTSLAELYADDEYNMKDIKESAWWLVEGAKHGVADCLLKIAQLYLDGQGEEYNFNEIMCQHAVADFNRAIANNPAELQDSKAEYEKLKEKYKDELDWAYLESMPNSIERKQQNIC